MMSERGAAGMNAFLELTKLASIDKKSPRIGKLIGGKGEYKKDFYTELIGNYHRRWEIVPEWYDQRLAQYYAFLPEDRCTEFVIRSQSPLVMGQGQSSILETHLTLHRIYGVPYIPGTALKGLTAHYCHQYLGEEEAGFRSDGAYYEILFGSTERAALIQYHDAFPTKDTVSQALVLDVMTPHHHKYNDTAASVSAPRDDDSPVPIPFLSVRADFRILLSCESSSKENFDWLELARKLVKNAIEHEGVGGKTNAGYGRFNEFIRG
ncbi:type III-B CRISPR module RAMP protein Cmr6 [Paenibacillus aquistagni]|nr:type III-B CRISPR module RAMP protein Cmr6 [Paenibacillus aquistagni]